MKIPTAMLSNDPPLPAEDHAPFDAADRALAGVGRLSLAAALDIAKLPGKILGSVAGMFKGASTQSPVAVGQQAADNEKAAQAQRDALDDRNTRVHALRRVALAISKGEQPDMEALALLKPGLQAYLKGLTPAECNIIVHSPFEARVRLFTDEITPRGVRTPAEVASQPTTPQREGRGERFVYRRVANDDEELDRAAALLA